MQDIRIGQGYDVHAFADNRDLMLGGIHVPHERGLLGHSDADVLLHAVCDALLGALALGDIGKHFPDSDPSYAAADSMLLLANIVNLIHNQAWKVHNIDITVMAERPKLAAYILPMRERLADVLETDLGKVSIKATTTEKLGFVGREEGIAAMAIVLLHQA